MQFDKFISTLLEQYSSSRLIFFLEDDKERTSLIREFMKKVNPLDIVAITSNVEEAIPFIKKHYEKIDKFSLDFHLGMEDSIPVAELLASLGNNGYNVYIHSDDPIGAHDLMDILPYANPLRVPQNIWDMMEKR